ncbi:hypothetical protein MSAN_00850800 [Mycena sanguinolenta]|uniref:EF-hand domain-containing protein n=1 Tax=Mycena sanguinolenta TaxID=230812 RepID=A0A8H6YVI2_9AGAR|nr:hypothetical protein MSAN_00850800 [Mycena sanguinolenta]
MSSNTMDTKIERADKALKDARTLIQTVAGSSSKKQTKAQTRKILNNVQQTMSVLSGIAEYDASAKAAVSVFMSVLQLEIDRRDNDESIVAVCYSMTSMIYVLRFLNRDAANREDLADQLAEEMANMSETIKDFGAFADVYYTKCKSWIVRFARSREFKTKIQDFADTFQQYQERIEFVLVAQMAGGQSKAAHELAEVKTSISTLIDRVGAPASDREKQALEYIKSNGEQILETTQGLTEIARKLHDTVTSSTVEAINDAFEDLLDQNSTLFEFKLKGATMELSEAIDRSTAKILNRMESGPHDLIDEPNIKEIWKGGNDWKFSVKCRIFVDALCNYYTEKFLKSESEEDSWTLKILSKVINYPAVGEAIDEDASGFISVHEMNHFLKKNKGLSTPVWFAFWAVGPQYLDNDYTDKIEEITEDLEERCRKLKTDDQDLNTSIDEYLDTLKLVACITEWAEWDAGASGLEELDDETEQELVDVATTLAEKKEELIEANLKAVGYSVDQSSLPSITEQPSFRIEQSIMVLLYLILRKHDEIISAGMQNMTAQEFAAKWQDMDASLFELVDAFHQRFKSLRRSWRSQKLDIELQVQCYAGGLFNGWYNEYDKEGNIIVKFLEDDDDDDEDSDDPAESGSSSGPAVSIDAKVDQLSTRVTALDARLDKIESMLKQILSSGLGGAAQGHQSGVYNKDGHMEEDESEAYQASSHEYGNRGEEDGQNDGDQDDNSNMGDPDEGNSGDYDD